MGLRDRLREDRERRKQEFAEKKEAYEQQKEEAKQASRERRGELRERLQTEGEKRAELKASGQDRVADARDKGARGTAKAAGVDTAGAIMTMMSREEGRNAVVALYRDRLERTKPRSAAALTRTPKDREVIPISRVSHVRLAKAGAMKVAVHVTVSGEDIVFRVSQSEGERFREELMKLVLGQGDPTPSPAPTTADDPTDQLRKFAALRDEGVISEEDFQAKKAQILGL